MDSAALIYATKFMLKVKEEDFSRTMALMERSILPRFSEVGFTEPFVIARKRRIDRVDREKAEAAVSALRRRLIENAPSDDPDYADDLGSLQFGLVRGVTSYAHGVLYHHKKNRRPEEYEMLRREMHDEKNRVRAAGVQLDCYAFHSSQSSGAFPGADTMAPPPGRRPACPSCFGY